MSLAPQFPRGASNVLFLPKRKSTALESRIKFYLQHTDRRGLRHSMDPPPRSLTFLSPRRSSCCSCRSADRSIDRPDDFSRFSERVEALLPPGRCGDSSSSLFIRQTDRKNLLSQSRGHNSSTESFDTPCFHLPHSSAANRIAPPDDTN